MTEKKLPFTREQIEKIIKKFPTPFHIYDEKGIIENSRELNKAFAWNEGFKEFFAVKALPNPYILSILKNQGFGTDCSSLPELVLSDKAGIKGENIMFSSNDTPANEYKAAKELGAIINLDDITHIPFLEMHAGLPELICFRYNPGPLKGGNHIIGHPEEAKYGFTREQLFEGYKLAKEKGVKRFGIHTMVASNELDPEYFAETAEILFNLFIDLHKELGISFEFINLSGGIGIPYSPDQDKIEWSDLSAGIKRFYDKTFINTGIAKPKIFLESGRAITGPHGFLVSTVLHMKHIYKDYVGLDSSMQNLMRPGLYGAYHHLTVMGKEHLPHDHKYDVTGSLCENNDKFAIDRMLPEIVPGDIVTIHDTGAHGLAMGFNYNAKLRCAELLLRPDGSVMQIRRPETIDDYFATLDFKGLKQFH
jgi:diaminopimelate decarboxylase